MRVYALLPARDGEDGPAKTIASARRISLRLRSQGPSAFSSFCETSSELDRAIAEAELMLDVIGRDERMAMQLGNGAGDGVYRLLFRAMASDPEEVRRFYSETVEPLVQHDREYKTDLLGTLEAYLGCDCNMNATARAVYAHRHTVAHRLARIRELCGLDPASGEDRERLGLGIKAYRIIEPDAAEVGMWATQPSSSGSGTGYPKRSMPSSILRMTVSSTATRANCFESPGMTSQGAPGWCVRASMSSTACS